MASGNKNKTEQEMIVERLSGATTTQQTRKLSSLKPCVAFQNRPQSAYKPDSTNIQEFAQQILSEGLITPYLITPTGDIVDGHRRKAAQDFLAKTKADGYAVDPDVAVIVMDGTKQDCLVAGLASNCQQNRLGDVDTLNGIAKLLAEGVDALRTRKAANLSASQWARYAAVLRYPEAKAYIDNDELSLNVASTLVIKAEGKGGTEGAKTLLASLEPLVEIERKEALKAERRYAAAKKNPPSSEVVVKNRWPRHLIDAWYVALDSGLPISGEAEFTYGASILEHRGVKTLVIPGKTIAVNAANYAEVKTIADALGFLILDLAPLLKQLKVANLMKHGNAGQGARRTEMRKQLGLDDGDALELVQAAAKAEEAAQKAKAEAEGVRIAAKAKAANTPNTDAAHAHVSVEERYIGPDPEQALIDQHNAENLDDLPSAVDDVDFSDEADSQAA